MLKIIANNENERYYEGKISFSTFIDSYIYHDVTFPIYPGTDPSPSPQPKDSEKSIKEVSK